MKLVYIEWWDHCSGTDRWETLEEIGKLEPALAQTTGYLVKETDKYIIVAATIFEGQLGLGAMCILKSCVKKRRVITKSQEKKKR